MALSIRKEHKPLSLMTDDEKANDLIDLLKANNKVSSEYIEMLKAEYKKTENAEMFIVHPAMKALVAAKLTGKEKEFILNFPREYKSAHKSMYLPSVTYQKKYARLKKQLNADIAKAFDSDRCEFWRYKIVKSSEDQKSCSEKPIKTFYEFIANEFKREILIQLDISMTETGYTRNDTFSKHSNLGANFHIAVKKGESGNCGDEWNALFQNKLVVTNEGDTTHYNYDKKISIDMKYEFECKSEISDEMLDRYAYHLSQSNHDNIPHLSIKAAQFARVDVGFRSCLRAEQIAASLIKYKKDLSFETHAAALIQASRWDSKKIATVVLEAGKVGPDTPVIDYSHYSESQTTAAKEVEGYQRFHKDNTDVAKLFLEFRKNKARSDAAHAKSSIGFFKNKDEKTAEDVKIDHSTQTKDSIPALK